MVATNEQFNKHTDTIMDEAEEAETFRVVEKGDSNSEVEKPSGNPQRTSSPFPLSSGGWER